MIQIVAINWLFDEKELLHGFLFDFYLILYKFY